MYAMGFCSEKKETIKKLFFHKLCKTPNKREYKLRFPSYTFLFFLKIPDQWFTRWWHHGDHSYFYWLVKGQLLLHALPHVQSAAVIKARGKKGKVKHPKWLRVERQNMIHACHTTVPRMFHKSNVLSLLLDCRPPDVVHSALSLSSIFHRTLTSSNDNTEKY